MVSISGDFCLPRRPGPLTCWGSEHQQPSCAGQIVPRAGKENLVRIPPPFSIPGAGLSTACVEMESLNFWSLVHLQKEDTQLKISKHFIMIYLFFVRVIFSPSTPLGCQNCWASSPSLPKGWSRLWLVWNEPLTPAWFNAVSNLKYAN